MMNAFRLLPVLFAFSSAIFYSTYADAQRPGAELQSIEGSARGRLAEEHPHSFTLQTGLGFLSLLRNAQADLTITRNGEEDVYKARFTGSPATSLAYDYRITNFLSLGAAIGQQKIRMTDFINSQNETLDNTQLKATRTLVGGRMLFHYGRAEKFEMYSGLRAGVTVWSFKVSGFAPKELSDVDIPAVLGTGVLPQFAIIPFGFKGYLTPALAVGAELALGSPHFAALQVGYSF